MTKVTVTDDDRLANLDRIIRCPNELSADRPCLGSLARDGEHLRCAACQAAYRVVGGVPVLRETTSTETNEWFEHMYQGRDCAVDLQNNYLSAERGRLADLVQHDRIAGPCLEVGCGTGIFAHVVPRFVGLEYSLQALLGPGMSEVPRVCANASRLPFADRSFQLAFSFSTLEHVEEVGRAFVEMHRVLAPGGILVLGPAWHCTRYQTELIPIRPYADLNLRQKLTKAFLPVLRWRPYKLMRRLPWRLWRRLSSGAETDLRWRRLTPAHHEYVLPDQDAVADLDCHEGILFYVRRGYQCLSHPAAWRQLIAGHDIVVLKKPAGNSSD